MNSLHAHIEKLILLKMNEKFVHIDDLSIYTEHLCSIYGDDKIEDWAKEHNKQARLAFIKLIAVSKKSTLGFTHKELELVILFLQYNIHEKMEFVPFIKKIFKRINEHCLSLNRVLKNIEKKLEFEKINKTSVEYFEEFTHCYNQEKSLTFSELNKYKQFCKQLSNFLENSIRLSAVHFQNQASLQITVHLLDLLDSEIHGNLNTCLQKVIYECMLLNSYQSNKEICFNILAKCNKDYLKGKTYEIVNFAVKLANSIRPIDSITSSYLLKLSILSSDCIDEMNNFELVKSNEDIMKSKAKEALSILIVLMEALQSQLEIADKSIVLAVRTYSLYGLVFSIRSTLKTVDMKTISDEEIWKKVIKELILMSFELSKAASEIVNNSSPEGHLPMDLDPQYLQEFISDNNDIDVTPQMVLLCSWRSVKEVSLLFGEITANGPISNENNIGLIFESEIKEIGDHFVKLLCETKHRGAFEQAHVGFGMLCSRLWHLNNDYINNLPKIWLRRLIIEIAGLTHSNEKLCATRRSAGVPFMVQAIIISEIDHKKDLKSATLHSVMKILIGFSQLKESNSNIDELKQLIFKTEFFKNEKLEDIQKTDDIKLNSLTEIKSHALNILRTLIKNNQLGDLIQDYLEDCLICAIICYDGNCWAEHNAATLLFGALITRIFGVQRTKDHLKLTHHNKLTGSKFFEKFPKLLDLMLQELKVFTDNNCTSIKPMVQCVLLILSRLYPSHISTKSDIDWKMNDFIELTSLCGESRVYKTRELAARALVQFLTEKNLNDVLEKLISTGIAKLSSFNAAHGYCLQIIEVIDSDVFSKCLKMKSLTKQFAEFFNQINRKVLFNLETSSNEVACYPLATACIKILSHLIPNLLPSLGCHPCKSEILNTIKRHLTENCLKDRPGLQNYEDIIIKFYAVHSDYSLPMDFWKNIILKGKENLKQHCFYLFHDSTLPKGDYSTFPIMDKVIAYPSDDLANYIMNNVNFEDRNFCSIACAFLYRILVENNKFLIEPSYTVIYDIMKWALTKQNENLHKCGNYFVLLAECFTQLLDPEESGIKKDISKEIFEDIYSTFVLNSWMGNSSLECRKEIAESIGLLRIDFVSHYVTEWTFDNSGLEFHWWTTVLHCLIDDDESIRTTAGYRVCSISRRKYIVCTEAILQDFFKLFIDQFCKQKPYIATVILFSWGTGFLQNEDYEIDDSDIFTKSHNYNYLDFEKLADHCVDCIKKYCKYERNNGVVDYRNMYQKYASHLQLPFGSFDELFYQYENHPIITDDIDNLLDPNYNKKLLCSKIYNKFRTL